MDGCSSSSSIPDLGRPAQRSSWRRTFTVLPSSTGQAGLILNYNTLKYNKEIHNSQRTLQITFFYLHISQLSGSQVSGPSFRMYRFLGRAHRWHDLDEVAPRASATHRRCCIEVIQSVSLDDFDAAASMQKFTTTHCSRYICNILHFFPNNFFSLHASEPESHR